MIFYLFKNVFEKDDNGKKVFIRIENLYMFMKGKPVVTKLQGYYKVHFSFHVTVWSVKLTA